MFASYRRHLMLAALLCTGALTACLPEDKDPGKTSDAGQLNGNYYASALGNVALQIQNSVVGDPSWFSQTNSSQLNLAAMGIDANVVGSPVRSHICPTGTGTEVVQITWLDGRDSANHFSMRGIGTNAGVMMGALRNRVSGDQIGTYDGSTNLQMASGTAMTIPSSCAGLGIPLGAPVLSFRIERPAAPVEEMARTEYRTVACGNDTRGMQMRGTMVQSRVVRYAADGTITPADPAAGWSAENMGNCVSDSIVTANSATTANGGSVALNNFADLAAQGFKTVLEAQLQMDCATTTINSDVMKKDAQGNVTRSKRDKSIDTCVKATASAAKTQLTDNDTANRTDRRDLCEDGTRTQAKSYLGISTGSYTAAIAGQINVDRVLDNRSLSSNSSQTGERARWVGQDPVGCTKNETYVATCGRVPGAPPRSSDFNAAGNKWNTGDINYSWDNWDWFNRIFNVCIGIFGDCEYIIGGGAYTLNWNYFREQKHLHADSDTTTARGGWNTNTWADRYTNFTVNFNYQPWTVPSATNQCRIRYKEIQSSCPLNYTALNAGSWNPYELSPNADFVTTLIPGGSYGGKAGDFYNSLRSTGEASGTVGLVWLNHKSCNIKGCDYYTTQAGPGTGSYIRSWRYSDTSSYSGAGTSVQTIMLNREPQMYDLVPAVTGVGPNGVLTFSDRVYLPNRGLHCGRIERRTYGSWPVLQRYWSCGGKGGCRLNSYWTSTSVTEVVTREWYGENSSNGTWSRPVVRYLPGTGGSYSSIGAIPNPIVRGP